MKTLRESILSKDYDMDIPMCDPAWARIFTDVRWIKLSNYAKWAYADMETRQLVWPEINQCLAKNTENNNDTFVVYRAENEGGPGRWGQYYIEMFRKAGARGWKLYRFLTFKENGVFASRCRLMIGYTKSSNVSKYRKQAKHSIDPRLLDFIDWFINVNDMAWQKIDEGWTDKVHTKWHPKEGLFTGDDPQEIADYLLKHSEDRGQAMQRLTFYMNRAGDNLKNKTVLNKVKKILSESVLSPGYDMDEIDMDFPNSDKLLQVLRKYDWRAYPLKNKGWITKDIVTSANTEFIKNLSECLIGISKKCKRLSQWAIAQVPVTPQIELPGTKRIYIHWIEDGQQIKIQCDSDVMGEWDPTNAGGRYNVYADMRLYPPNTSHNKLKRANGYRIITIPVGAAKLIQKWIEIS